MNHGPIALNQITSSVSSLDSSSGTQSSNDLHSDSAVTWDNNAIARPHLPWMTRNNSSLAASINSDIHIVKRHVPSGSPRIPIKKWRRWTWHKIWLILMNTLVSALHTLHMSDHGNFETEPGICSYLFTALLHSFWDYAPISNVSHLLYRISWLKLTRILYIVYQSALVFLIGEATIVNCKSSVSKCNQRH